MSVFLIVSGNYSVLIISLIYFFKFVQEFYMTVLVMKMG